MLSKVNCDYCKNENNAQIVCLEKVCPKNKILFCLECNLYKNTCKNDHKMHIEANKTHLLKKLPEHIFTIKSQNAEENAK